MTSHVMQPQVYGQQPLVRWVILQNIEAVEPTGITDRESQTLIIRRRPGESQSLRTIRLGDIPRIFRPMSLVLARVRMRLNCIFRNMRGGDHAPTSMILRRS